MESLTQAIGRLRARGYDLSFHAEDGKLRCVESHDLFEPDEIVIDDIIRLEGDSNPSEQAMVFGLRVLDEGPRGTWTIVYGPNMARPNVEIVHRLGVG